VRAGGGPATGADERPRGGRGHGSAGLGQRHAKGKERGHRAWRHSLKGAGVGERKEGEVRCSGHRVEEGQGGPSRARHVTRWREGHQRHAPGAAVLGRARGSRGGLGHRHVGAAAQYQIVVNFIQTQISNGI
jgi:hypothetical protein